MKKIPVRHQREFPSQLREKYARVARTALAKRHFLRSFFKFFSVEPSGIGRYKLPHFTPCLLVLRPRWQPPAALGSEALSGALPDVNLRKGKHRRRH